VICNARGIIDNALSIARTAMNVAQSAMSFTHNATTRHAYDVLQRDCTVIAVCLQHACNHAATRMVKQSEEDMPMMAGLCFTVLHHTSPRFTWLHQYAW
jgi:hypothetical protein